MKKRGRPRKFDEAAVAEAMMELFWRQGFTATSLDDLAAATGVNRPSLYSAFGNKLEMYLMCLDKFTQQMAGMARTTFDDARTLEQALTIFFDQLIEYYFSAEDDDLLLGCPVFSGAIAETSQNEDIRKAVHEAMKRVERHLQETIAKHCGDRPKEDVDIAVDTAVSIFLSLGTRVRSGMARKDVKRAAKNSLKAALAVVG